MPWISRRAGRILILAAAVAAAALAAGPVAAPSVAGATQLSGAAQATRTVGFVLDHGAYLPVPTPRGLENLVAGSLSPVGINDPGQLTGSYLDPTGRERGFLLDRDRDRLTQVDVPGAMGTQGQGINNRGQLVGVYSDTSNPSITGAKLRGFLLEGGRYVRLDYPGAVSSQANGINDQGQVVGEYQAGDGTFHGYLWERGRFQTLRVPGGATGINDRGQITGVTGDAATPDGYLLDGKRLATFERPGAQVTIARNLDDRGQIVGYSLTSLTATTASGFVRTGDGRFTEISRPGAVFTALFGINNRGQIAGIAPTAEDLANLPGAGAMAR